MYFCAARLILKLDPNKPWIHHHLAFRMQNIHNEQLLCMGRCNPLVVPNEQLHRNKWRISALLNGTIIVITRDGNVIHSASLFQISSWFVPLSSCAHSFRLHTAITGITWLKAIVVDYKIQKHEIPYTPTHLFIKCGHRRTNKTVPFISSLIMLNGCRANLSLVDRLLTSRN